MHVFLVEITRQSEEALKALPKGAELWRFVSATEAPKLVVAFPLLPGDIKKRIPDNDSSSGAESKKDSRKSSHFGGRMKPVDFDGGFIVLKTATWTNTKFRQYSLVSEAEYRQLQEKCEEEKTRRKSGRDHLKQRARSPAATAAAESPPVAVSAEASARNQAELQSISLIRQGLHGIDGKARKIEILGMFLREVDSKRARSTGVELDSHSLHNRRLNAAPSRPLLVSSRTVEQLFKLSTDLVLAAKEPDFLSVADDLRIYMEEIRKRGIESLLRSRGINLPNVTGSVDDLSTTTFNDLYDDILTLTAKVQGLGCCDLLSAHLDALDLFELQEKRTLQSADTE